MITVEIRCGEATSAITVSGHAGAGSKGNDIVCAAASMLAQTLMQEAETYAEKWQADGFCVFSKEAASGYLAFSTAANADAQTAWRYALHMAATGFQMLASTYPNYVKFTWVEEK